MLRVCAATEIIYRFHNNGYGTLGVEAFYVNMLDTVQSLFVISRAIVLDKYHDQKVPGML